MPILFHVACFAALLLIPAATAGADAMSELASFSAFKDLKLESLAGGAVKAARGPAMSFPRGLAIESCYLVPRPLSKTAELHLQWNPVRHPELKVYLHGDLSSRAAAAEFEKLAAAPANAAVKAFAVATRKLGSDHTELQMSNADVKAFSGGSPQTAGMSPGVAAFWTKLLQQRTQAYVAGGMTRLPPYETGNEAVHVSEEIGRLLKESGKVRGQFSALLDATALTGGKGSIGPALYWELVDVEGQAAASLGAVYHKSGQNTWQSVEVHYYSSGGYYVLLTFQQMWPVSVDGQDSTLVWRGDLISAATLATRRGVERMGSGTAMMRETQKSISAMLRDIGKGP
jgi:hypothetical protein